MHGKIFYAIAVRLLPLLAALCLAGCGQEPQTVSATQLQDLSRHWQEPKVAGWYYTGSDAAYHYFLFRDLDGDHAYRVQRGEMEFPLPFPATREEARWRPMPWGPEARRAQGGRAP